MSPWRAGEVGEAAAAWRREGLPGGDDNIDDAHRHDQYYDTTMTMVMVMTMIMIVVVIAITVVIYDYDF